MIDYLEIISAAVIFTGLVVLSIQDIKTKRIGIIPIMAMMLLLIIFARMRGTGMTEVILGILPGAAAALISLITRGKIGIGDALLIIAIGIGCGFYMTLEIWMTALLLSAVFGIVMLALKKATGKTEIPFVPFLLAGFTVLEAVSIVKMVRG